MIITAEAMITAVAHPWFHCEIRVASDQSPAEALGVAETLFAIIAPGKRRLVRQHPTAEEEIDFMTDQRVCKAYARFTFSELDGPSENAKPWDGQVRYTALREDKA